MTKKITISLPDDVAERLSHEDNVSAYVTESVRKVMEAEQVRQQLRQQGYEYTDEELAEAEEEDRRLREKITPELWEHAQQVREQARSGRR